MAVNVSKSSTELDSRLKQGNMENIRSLTENLANDILEAVIEIKGFFRL
jgi:hypothetical protein